MNVTAVVKRGFFFPVEIKRDFTLSLKHLQLQCVMDDRHFSSLLLLWFSSFVVAQYLLVQILDRSYFLKDIITKLFCRTAMQLELQRLVH